MEKFQKLKIDTNLLNNFDLELICPAFDLEYMFEMLIKEFNY